MVYVHSFHLVYLAISVDPIAGSIRSNGNRNILQLPLLDLIDNHKVSGS